MKSIHVKIIYLYILLFLNQIFIGIVPSYAEETLQYKLTNDKVKRVYISEIRDGVYSVTIELNESERNAFTRLTEQNIGKKLIITLSGHTLISAVIKGKIDSGVVSFVESDLEEATQKIKEILKPSLNGNENGSSSRE